MGVIYFLLGLNQPTLALNYLVVHAYTKIFFFVTVGMLILNCNGCQDLR
jgi:NADH:ubiquinone oxidoreductase subunit 5 (subunit L)/multisubunit Na+/H+ antiporter MnhA subunit